MGLLLIVCVNFVYLLSAIYLLSLKPACFASNFYLFLDCMNLNLSAFDLFLTFVLPSCRNQLCCYIQVVCSLVSCFYK